MICSHHLKGTNLLTYLILVYFSLTLPLSYSGSPSAGLLLYCVYGVNANYNIAPSVGHFLPLEDMKCYIGYNLMT
jgi:hypothetical protein